MRISVFTVCTPEYDLAETAARLARYGYEGVEWRVQRPDPTLAAEAPSYWRNNLSTVDLDTIVEQAQALAELSRSHGLEMPSLATYLPCSDHGGVERVMRAALAMGVPMLRVQIPRYDRTQAYPELYSQTVADLEDLATVAAAYSVKVLIEIHMGTIAPSAGLAHRLLDGMDPGLIGAIYDPGNMVCEGYEAWRMGLELLGPYLAHVHVKNYAWQPGAQDARGTLLWKAQPAPLARGIVDWGQVVEDLKSVDYDGWLSLEDFDSSTSTEAKLEAGIAYLRSLGA